MKFPYSAMFFRRTKKPGTDESVLTETLRSLQDLIEDPQATSQAQHPETSAPNAGTEATAASPASPRSLHTDTHGIPVSPTASAATQPEPAQSAFAPENEDVVPVLNNVVYMPIPRSPVMNSTITPSPDEQNSAHDTVARELVAAVEESLNKQGDSIDPRLVEELRNAVAASLEDWSLRTQEMILSKLSPNKGGHENTSGDEN